MTYKKSSVLITGASQGIGRSIAIRFASDDERPIILLARNKKNLEETKELCEKGGASAVEIIVCDATRWDLVKSIQLPAHFPPPGILINNAGSYLYKTISDTTDEEFRNQVNANLFTAVNMVRRFRPDMEKMDRALIINICSIAALRGLKDSGAYSAAKHAVLGYTRSLREELKMTDVGVTAVNLGQTHSTSWDDSDMSAEKLIDPSDVAAMLVQFAKLSPRTLVEEIKIQPQHGRVSPM